MSLTYKYYDADQQIADKRYNPNDEQIHCVNEAGEVCCVIEIGGARRARELVAKEIMMKLQGEDISGRI